MNARFILKARVLKVLPLIGNFAVLCGLAAGFMATARMPLPWWMFFTARLLVLLLAFYYFIVKIARGVKEG